MSDVGAAGRLDHCPVCGADWRGDEYTDLDGNVKATSRLVGAVWNDRVQEWVCPECGARWSRWDESRITDP